MTALIEANPFVDRRGVRVGDCVITPHVARLMHAQLGEAIGDVDSIRWMDLHRELDRRFAMGVKVPVREVGRRLTSVATYLREDGAEVLRVAPFAIVTLARHGSGFMSLVRPDPIFGMSFEPTTTRISVRARELKIVRSLRV